jgi:hypothetical protein
VTLLKASMSSSAKSICFPASVPERASVSASLASTRLQDDPALLLSVAVFTPREWSWKPTTPAGGAGVDDSVTSEVAGLSDATHFLERMRCVTDWPEPVGGSNRKKSASPAMWRRSTPPPVMGTGGGPLVPAAIAPGSTTAARATPASATATFVLVVITDPLLHSVAMGDGGRG